MDTLQYAFILFLNSHYPAASLFIRTSQISQANSIAPAAMAVLERCQQVVQGTLPLIRLDFDANLVRLLMLFMIS
jgi:hypothetical protein